jgi:pimeloyl-ACP methyl ester carboxylesterase
MNIRASSFISDGVRIRYIDQGKGVALVLVHGFTDDLDRAWVQTGFMANLSQDHRVTALDLRGHSHSEKPHDSNAYGEKMCLDVIRLMDHVGVQRAHMVGYSLGARVVGYLLTVHPDRFITATLGGSPPRVGWPPDEAQRAEQDAQDMEQRLRSGVSDGQDYVAMAAVVRSRNRQVVSEAQLAQVKIPTIGIVGSQDPRLAGMQALRAMMPALIRVIVIEGATHMAAYRGPELLQTVREFVTSHGPAAAHPGR